MAKPQSVAIDSRGDVYVTNEAGQDAVQEVTADGVMRTVLNRSSPKVQGKDYFKLSLAIDNSDAVVLGVGQRKTVERLLPDGGLVLLGGQPGVAGSVDGPAKSAKFQRPSAVAVDRFNNVFVADSRAVRRIGTDGVVVTFAGSEQSKSFHRDGSGREAAFSFNLNGLVAGPAGNLFLAENFSDEDEGHTNFFGLVRDIGPQALVMTLVGNIHGTGSQDGGVGHDALLGILRGITIDKERDLFVTEEGSFGSVVPSILKIDPRGRVTIFMEQDGEGDQDGTHPKFRDLTGIFADGSGRLYVVDTEANKLHRIERSRNVTTLCRRPQQTGAR